MNSAASRLHTLFVNHASIVVVAVLSIVAALSLIACDSSENERLLNPTVPDSTRFRVVNLADGDPVYVTLGSLQLAFNVEKGQTSDYRSFLVIDRATLLVTRGTRTDTLRDQRFTPGSRVTMFVLGSGPTASIVLRETGRLEEADLKTANLGRLTFINGVPDPAGRLVKRGCQSGDTIFLRVPFGGASAYEAEGSELSLFLFGAPNAGAIRSARHTLSSGNVAWMIAARDGSTERLYVIGPGDAQLREMQEETRTEASLEVFNALANGSTISARIGGATVASALGRLSSSAPAAVEACRSVSGDSLEVLPEGAAPVGLPIRMEVASRALAVVYGSESTGVRALALRIDPPQTRPGLALLRVVNVATSVPAASVLFGDGSPRPVAGVSLPLLEARLGRTGGWVTLRAGTYPLLLQESATGRFLAGGVQDLPEGYHTLFIVDAADGPALMLLTHDGAPSSIRPIANPGSRIHLFNLSPDHIASFSAGAMRLDTVPYSYVFTTVVPNTETSVTTSAGVVTIDQSSGTVVVGVTGSGGTRSTLTFPGSSERPAAGNAALRFVSAVPGGPEFEMKAGDVATFTSAYGVPSHTAQLREGRYSFVVRQTGSSEKLAEASGIELIEGRRHIAVLGPRADAVEGARYRILVFQE